MTDWFDQHATTHAIAIRRASWQDTDAIVALGAAFLASSGYAAQIAYNPAHMGHLVAGLLGRPDAAIFVSETDGQIVGVIGVALFDHAMSGERAATEVTWYVHPAHRGQGLKLLRAAEEWARAHGAMIFQVTAPTPDLAVLYPRLGFEYVETAFQKRFVPLPIVVDGVLADPDAYRAAVQALPFATFHASADVDFHNMALCPFPEVPAWIAEHHPGLTITLSAARRAPAGQVEPNYIHTDRDMGEWTGILYLTPNPPAGDGTMFWRRKDTGAIQSGAAFDLEDAIAWRDRDQWAPWHLAEARYNRLVLFDSTYYHSRAIEDSYGDDAASARLIQVIFGSGKL